MMVLTRHVPLQASKGARLAMRSLACPLVGSSASYDCMQSCDLLGCGTRIALRKHRCPGDVLICLPSWRIKPALVLMPQEPWKRSLP